MILDKIATALIVYELGRGFISNNVCPDLTASAS